MVYKEKDAQLEDNRSTAYTFLGVGIAGLIFVILFALDIIKLPMADEKTPDGASEAEEQQIRRKEGERLLKYLEGKNCYVIALAINGKMLDSVALSEKVSDLMVKGNSHIVLVIGGSLGIADEVLKRADEKISFSKMTFPHQLMRVILLEQLYRSYRIINHEPYHK